MPVLALLTFTFAALLAGLVVGAVLNRKSIERRKDQRAAELFAQIETLPTYFNEDEIQTLPEPARRFFLRNLNNDMPHPSCLRVRESGQAREQFGTPWTEFVAEEYVLANPPGRLWFARLRPFPLIWVDRFEHYLHARAQVQAKLLSSLDTRNQTDQAAVRASLLRYIASLPLLPGALLPADDRSWSEAGPDAAKFTLRDGDVEVSGVFHVDELGNVIRFESDDWPYLAGKLIKPARAIVRYSEHRVFGSNGDLQLPTRLDFEWELDGQQFHEAELHVNELHIDVPHAWSAPWSAPAPK
jgi:hypothetical protein